MAVSFSTSGTASAGGVQQSYALLHAALLEGQLSDIRDNTISTCINETVNVLPFGDVQVYNLAGTVANSATTISGASGTVLGVNVLTYVDETAVNGDNRPGVKSRQVLNVASQAAVAVYGLELSTPLPSFACCIQQVARAKLVNSATHLLRAGLFAFPTLASSPLPQAAVWQCWN